MEPMEEPMDMPPEAVCTSAAEIKLTGRQQDASCASTPGSIEGPLHLLRPSGDHRSLVADPVVLKKLRELGPVTVLSVVGTQRGGKSTLMNLLHGRKLQGFQMGHYLDPQTFGLWLWPKPHPRRQGVTILLVDSEGLDSPHVPQHYNWLLSAVTLLISDVFMYQTKGSIEKSAVERLDMILKVAEQLGKADSSDTSRQRLGNSFLWLLRDHQLQMRRSPREELLEKLDPVQVRALKHHFVDYDCVPLPRPASDDTMRRLDQHTFQDLDCEFREEYVVFERRLQDLLVAPRQLLGQDLTGASLSDLLQQYLVALQQQKGVLGDICDMPTQRELLRQLAARRAVDAGVQRYRQVLQDAGLSGKAPRLPLQPSELLAAHNKARIEAQDVLRAEGAAAGLEEEDLSPSREMLEGKLASWCSQSQLSTFNMLQGPSQTEINESTNIVEAIPSGSSAAIGTPAVTLIPTLNGGLLFDLWNENARRALPTYESWLKNLGTLKEVALSSSGGSEEAQQPPVALIGSYYARLTETLALARGDPAHGPWGAAATVGADNLQVQISQHGDELAVELLHSALQHSVKGLHEELEAHKQHLTQQVEGASKELHTSLDELRQSVATLVENLSQQDQHTSEALANMVAAAKDGEIRSRDSAVALAKAYVDEGIKNSQDMAERAVQELDLRLRKALTDQQMQQEQRAADVASRAAEALRAEEERARQAASDLRQVLNDTEARAGEALRTTESCLREELKRADERAAMLQARLMELQESSAGAQKKHESLLAEFDQRAEARIAGLERAAQQQRQEQMTGLKACSHQLEAAARASDERLSECRRDAAKAASRSEADMAEMKAMVQASAGQHSATIGALSQRVAALEKSSGAAGEMARLRSDLDAQTKDLATRIHEARSHAKEALATARRLERRGSERDTGRMHQEFEVRNAAVVGQPSQSTQEPERQHRVTFNMPPSRENGRSPISSEISPEELQRLRQHQERQVREINCPWEVWRQNGQPVCWCTNPRGKIGPVHCLKCKEEYGGHVARVVGSGWYCPQCMSAADKAAMQRVK